MHDNFLAVVKVMEEYDIPIHGLKEGVYDYRFEIGSSFFEYFENPDLPGGDVVLSLKLHKRQQFIEFDFEIKGILKLICDRCLDLFDYAVDIDEKLFLRYGDSFEELDDNIIVIPREESRFNIAQFIYEFTALNIPYKKLHPDNEDGTSGCNPEMLKKIEELRVEKKKNDNIDPRWDKLKNLN